MVMLSDALRLLSLLIPAGVVGALAGLLTARRFLSRQLKHGAAAPEPDQFTSAALDEAAVRYATTQGRPELADIVSRKLHLLHRLGTQGRWRP